MCLTCWFETERNIREKARVPQKMSAIARKSKKVRPTLLRVAGCGALLSGLLAGVAAYAQAPSISSQPQSITLGGGGNATFAVTVSGDPPLVHQWQSNGVPIVNATNTSLTLTNAQLAWSGSSYSVLVTNASGSTNSSPATLTVIGTAVTPANLNSIWTPNNSPYVVDTNVVVTNLTIQPGVTVMFSSGSRLEVVGALSAVGTSNSPIQFVAATGVSNWSGIYFNSSPGALELTWCVVQGSTNSGLQIHNCSPTLRYCTIRQNSALRGAGLQTDAPLVLESCIILSNQITLPFGAPLPPGGYLRGAGIHSEGGTLTLRSCQVQNNVLSFDFNLYTTIAGGGGIYSSGPVILEDCDISGNKSTTLYNGGGARSGRGGGVFCEGSLQCFRSTIVNNEECANWYSGGGGVYVDGTAVLSQCVLSGNRSGGGDSAGGAALISTSLLLMTNCLVTGNQSQPCYGNPSIHAGCLSGNAGFIENCTIAYNAGQDSIYFQGLIRNSIIYFNSSPQIWNLSSNLSVAYCDVQGGYAGVGNTNTDPLFADTTTYLLSNASPFVDAGDPAPVYSDRFFPPSRAQARNDMGAYGGPTPLFQYSFGAPHVLYNGQETPPAVLSQTNAIQISIQTSFSNAFIRYTLDGSDPIIGTSYSGPFNVMVPATLRVIADSNHVTSASIASVSLFYFGLVASTPGGGSVSVNPPAGPYLINTTPTLSATTNPGWMFMGWSGDVSDTNATIAVTMDRTKASQAVFGTTLNATVSSGVGTVSLNPSVGPYAYGSVVRFSAVPGPGYYLAGWGNAAYGRSNSPMSFLVTNAAQTVSAVFNSLPANSYSLTLLANGNGSVTQTPLASFYTNGQPVVLTATPDPGYLFTGWSSDASETANPLSVVMNSSKIITANFTTSAPPTIISQPMSQVQVAGSNATLNVAVVGTTPLTYQWRLNGTNLAAANLPALSLPALSTGQAGRYDVVVTNLYGSVTSQVARITVLTPTIYWPGGGDGQSWSDPSNWNRGSLPTSSDTIFIGGTNGTVAVSSGLTVSNLLCQRSMALSASLSVFGGVDIAQSFVCSSGISISASGRNAVMIAEGNTTADGVSMFAQQGGLVR